MIDNEIGGTMGIDELRISAQFLNSISHSGKVDDSGNAGVILKQNACRPKRDLDSAGNGLVCLPGEDLFDISLVDLKTKML